MKYFRRGGRGRVSSTVSSELDEPISAEIFSVERLEQHAESLAKAQEVSPVQSSGISLRRRLRSNAAGLRAAFHTLLDGIRKGHAMTPAAGWLVDNYYIVDEHIRAVRHDLPAGYYKQLPKLSNGPLRGYPRVYGLAWAIVAHTDNCFELDTLVRFCRAYQRVQPLTIGELWAIAITLRVLLIENLSRLAAGSVSRLQQRDWADSLADEWLADEQVQAAPDTAALRAFEDRALPSALGVQLFQRLRDRDPETVPALKWLHRTFAAQNTTADDVVHAEHLRQGAVNVSVRNIITSLRLISSVDWAKFFESVSLADELLRERSSYGAFDFSTRDLYRHAIEDLSRRSRYTEIEVVHLALRMAQGAAEVSGAGPTELQARRAREPGYYLVSDGRGGLERELAYRIPWSQRLARWARAGGIGGYAGGIAALSMAMTAALIYAAGAPGPGAVSAAALVSLALLAASDIGITIVNLWVNHFCNPEVLPGLELVDGVPPELRTIIAVPILLTSDKDIDEHVRGLEVHYLAAQDGDIRFALLTDWVDSTTETVPEDQALLERVAAGIARLNRLHGGVHGDDRFLLLHRKRLWDRTQGIWMGWERKRGKLHEFNRWLMGGTDMSFVSVGGRPPQRPAGVRYVISLDADTRLPRGAALALIGKMAHPLNRPVIEAGSRLVTAGYGILQPRVTPSLPIGRDGSIYQSVFSGSSGIDPYAFAVSDVYQDMFGEGSYSGKGIYDVTAFETTLEGRVGDDCMLSHDLFEGVYARCGLASDVEVVDEYPARYDVAAARQHRWTRGDWQLLPWVLGAHPMALLGRWKMFDNLRRSLLPPAVLLGLALCWTESAAPAWSLFFLGTIILPVLLPFLINLRSARKEARQTATLILLRLVFWADQAWMLSDAIVRTVYRLTISRRHLLEWTTAAQAKLDASSTVWGFYRGMSGSVLLVASLTLLLLLAAGGIPWIAVPFLLGWVCAPVMARAVSLPARPATRESLTADDERRMRIMARQTWSFFDTFVTAQHNMLPPDNFQEMPNAVVANRTSPTNIGLYLLSVAAAREFGWIGTSDAADRLEATFSTLDKLERHRGHFYNWYDTFDLRPLDPKYVSTVDSGNLAAHLLTLEGMCRRWSSEPKPASLDVGGILDTLEQLREVARILEDGRRKYGVSPRQLGAAIDALHASLESIDSADQAAALTAILRQVDSVCDLAQALTDEGPKGGDVPLLHWSDMLRANVQSRLRDMAANSAAAPLAARLDALAGRARALAMATEFGFLVDPARQLLSIGYRPLDRAQDPSCYDLLASEARLASFVAIAKGDLPVRHWFRLGRMLTPLGRGSALVSWTGSMFEYLMPVLVMREPEGSLLGDTSRMIVRRQIEYGNERNLPWGVSESAFNARDREFTYQYSSFGVPGLGLKRGLGDEAVVAPYATGLAMMIDPKAAMRNFDRLQKLGARGLFGWYEALDFSPARLPEGTTMAPVRAFMAHHQGMILVAIANVLKDGMFRSCFHSNSIIQATELLLQERTPGDSDRTAESTDEVQSAPALRELAAAVPRRFTSPHHAAPRTHLLSNGNYSVMLTAAGSGYSRWRDIAVTRWVEDSTCDPYGFYVFLRDVANGEVWSAGYQPVGREPDSYDVAFFEDHAQIARRDGSIITSTEILVSGEDDAEVRRVSITNQGSRVSEIELTTYAEVVLATADSDSAHPAFSKLFVQTEFVADSGALLATRRVRDPKDPGAWVAHHCVLEGEGIGGLQYETDRARFLGRARDLRNAVSIVDAHPLSNTTGTVLDPVLALRRRVRIAPGETARIAFWTGVGGSREQVLALVDKHRDMAAFDRAKTLAWTQAQVQLRYLGIDFEEAHGFQRIANRVLYSDSSLRAPRDILEKNRLGQSALWPHGISGDLPIVLVTIDDESDLEIVKQLLRAHEYWRLKRLAVDLVILNDRPPSYASELQQHLDSAIRTSQARRDEDGSLRGAVFSLRADLLPSSVCDLLQTAARAVFVARRGTLNEQLARLREPEPVPRRRRRNAVEKPHDTAKRTVPPSEFFNGLGGFAAQAREYVIILDEGQWTPAPWINVIANPQFGFLASADGSGSTWSQNAQQNPLTPWSNDPVGNAPAEAIYIRDEQTEELWSATPLPIRLPSHTYVVRHGFGYSRYEHTSHGIGLDLLQFVPLEDSIKISRLKIVNLSGEFRRLSVTHYLDWVLGNQRAKMAPFTVTEIEPKTGALLARNSWGSGFQSRVAFMDMAGRQQTCTADRAEFIGRHGSLAEPAALLGARGLTNRVGGGLDPCGAMLTKIALQPGEEFELKFLLGQEASSAAAVTLLERYRTLDLDAVLKSVTDYWEETLGNLQVATPDRSMDILLNGWLLYQTLACRVWARTAFYQSSGAYGFRDQLQDVMALVVARPNIARGQILRAASRQFEAGDVQHWWLPDTGQGIRTRISDNRIWLPFVVAHYLEVTEDFGLLDEQLPFLVAPPLAADQLESFSAPDSTPFTAPLFEHCVRALDSSLAIGSHGLPLFGTGDWNDGMNRVGVAGRGESVWLGWFLHAALLQFAPIAERRGAADTAAVWRKHAFALQQAIEREAWDGDWYRRGYFDDGTPLGSVLSDECRIDSIAQSWGVISQGAERERAVRAMAAVNAQLVSRSDGLVKLFTPAFDHTLHDPGYIKAYPPGLRENGGQYTHAALWSVLAFALLGDGDRAAELFSILNPINHASTRAGIHRYKVEPYVVCADVYSAPQHIGRGGWTWYTGSAGWMYRTAMEGILGIRLRGRTLLIEPCIPRAWTGFEITYKYGTSRYRIAVENPNGVNGGIVRASLDGAEISGRPCEIALNDDGRHHHGLVTLG